MERPGKLASPARTRIRAGRESAPAERSQSQPGAFPPRLAVYPHQPLECVITSGNYDYVLGAASLGARLSID
jgi:hypothetical protein